MAIKPIQIDLPIEDKNYVSLLEIEKVVRDITKVDIRVKTRKREYVEARALFYFIASEFTIYSVSQIARHVNMHHASVIYNNLVELIKVKKSQSGATEYVEVNNIFEKVEFLLAEVKRLNKIVTNNIEIDEYQEL
jgi:chromosomal replication initiation ATPase DnaA